MSTVKSKKYQVGTDATSSNNFTIYQPATPDGTLRIGVGNADSPTEVFAVASTGITMASGKGIGGNPPQVTVYTSGSGTYTVPTGAQWLQVRMVGGGCGGGGGAGNGSNGTTVQPGSGGNTTFGTSLLTATGSIRAGNGGGGTPGTATVSSPATSVVALSGGTGGSWSYNYGVATPMVGAVGSNSPFGGAGAASSGSALSNTGSGGGGGRTNNTAGRFGGSGGSSGGYIEAIITSPSATYAYAVGAGGTGGAAADGNGGVGGAGGSGVIYITAYFG